jgi:hypothetical protein
MKLVHQILLLSSTSAVTLKSDSYSAEMALAQLEQELFTPCLCFRYKGYNDDAPGTLTNKIADGGYIVDVDADGKCTPAPADPPVVLAQTFRRDVTNQSCVYKLWMCACWASQVDGCICGKENADDTVTMIRPLMGECPSGSGPLLNPKAQDAGGMALKCAPNPCLACCACGRGKCSGNGDPADNDT